MTVMCACRRVEDRPRDVRLHKKRHECLNGIAVLGSTMQASKWGQRRGCQLARSQLVGGTVRRSWCTRNKESQSVLQVS